MINSSKPESSGTGEAAKCDMQVKKIHYRSVIQTARHIYANEGAAAFCKGIYPRMTMNVPSTALSWGTYEIVKGFLVGKE
mmetsp:Transcript_13363/g.22729  ORF Transcript_13363/g.22729 Transcript_13363/m.22729 type:complete len:80 (+) Transcript_13363:888-1127(+)